MSQELPSGKPWTSGRGAVTHAHLDTAIVSATGHVVQVHRRDHVPPPAGCRAVQAAHGEVHPGMTWDGARFHAPPPGPSGYPETVLGANGATNTTVVHQAPQPQMPPYPYPMPWMMPQAAPPSPPVIVIQSPAAAPAYYPGAPVVHQTVGLPQFPPSGLQAAGGASPMSGVASAPAQPFGAGGPPALHSPVPAGLPPASAGTALAPVSAQTLPQAIDRFRSTVRALQTELWPADKEHLADLASVLLTNWDQPIADQLIRYTPDGMSVEVYAKALLEDRARAKLLTVRLGELITRLVPQIRTPADADAAIAQAAALVRNAHG